MQFSCKDQSSFNKQIVEIQGLCQFYSKSVNTFFLYLFSVYFECLEYIEVRYYNLNKHQSLQNIFGLYCCCFFVVYEAVSEQIVLQFEITPSKYFNTENRTIIKNDHNFYANFYIHIYPLTHQRFLKTFNIFKLFLTKSTNL